VCGEQPAFTLKAASENGSPPRVRGTAFASSASSLVTRITPACAGNSVMVSPLTAKMPDHPRVCGEQPARPLRHSRRRGSPPRVRGTAPLVPLVVADDGITPACAGNSGRRRYIFRAAADHPRVCGEQFFTSARKVAMLGSPPRVRGTARLQPPLCLPAGITPACAGNSALSMVAVSGSGDHPRVCGEQHRETEGRQHRYGSPPRVRGTDRRYPLHITPPRITPACAGNSRCHARAVFGYWDHPRVCGEQGES